MSLQSQNLLIHFNHEKIIYLLLICVKSVRIQSFSGPYSVRMPENTDPKNSEYDSFLRSAYNASCSCY